MEAVRRFSLFLGRKERKKRCFGQLCRKEARGCGIAAMGTI